VIKIKTCKYCGVELEDELDTCPYCGSALILFDLSGLYILGGLMG
jgi:RNA polymerase subunit RPABC4/transcription elongation factor Spt4